MRFTITFILSFFLGINILAQECKVNYEKAEECRRKGQYDKALNLYAKARDCGDASYGTKSAAMIQVVTKLKIEKETVKKFGSTKRQQDSYIIVPSMIYLPSGTEEQIVNVESSGNWGVRGKSNIINVSKKNTKTLTIASISENTSTKPRKSSVTIECGEITRTIIVEQDGVPEVLEYQSKYMNIPYEGGKFVVDLNTNTKWSVDYSDWYKATPLNNDSTHMVIIVDKNTKNEDRNGTIVVRSESGTSYDEMEIHQYANESNIFTAVDSIIRVGVQGDTLMIPVISDNPTWTPSDCPSWCKEVKVSPDSLELIIVSNDNILPREGFANIKSNDRVSGIWIMQEARVFNEYKENRILGGRNISFGIAAGYEAPFVGSTSSSPYNGSVLNYSLGNSAENVNYNSAVGFHVGAFADMRLYKNIYLKTGLDYRYVSYSNSFSGDVTRYYNQLLNSVYVGEFQNHFKEDYTFHFLEIPILASYRFVLAGKNNLQLNFGPMVSFALNGKMKYSGNSDSESVYQHSIVYNKVGPVIGSAEDEHMRYFGNMNLFSNTVNGIATTSTGMSVDRETSFVTVASPFDRVNLGLRAGLTYEYAGVQFDLSYTYMVTNMANSKFWESDRYPIFNQTSDVLMSGYKHRISGLQLSVGYVFRYKNEK